jgi:hypothetical protein
MPATNGLMRWLTQQFSKDITTKKQLFFSRTFGSTARSTIASDASSGGLIPVGNFPTNKNHREKSMFANFFFFFGSRKVSVWSTVNQVSAIALAFVVKFR